MRFRALVDDAWSTGFGVARDALQAGGVVVVEDAPAFADYRGIYLLRLGATCLVSAPRSHAARVRARVAGRGIDAVFTREGAAVLAGDDATLVLGPSWHGYVHRDDFAHAPTGRTRPLTPADGDAVARFRAGVADADWSEGGFGTPLPDVCWGAFDGGALVAMGNMTDFAGAPADVGLVTLADARGRGHATRLAVDMTAWALTRVDVVRYRALTENAASLAVAARTGFTGYAENLAVRLRA